MKTFKISLLIIITMLTIKANAQIKILTNGNVGVGLVSAPQNKLDVNGNIQISNASIPMGLMTEVGGTTPLLNLSVNFREPNKTSSYMGAGFRIDSRPSAPLFQWLYMPSDCNNSACTRTLMQLTPGTNSADATFNVLGVVQSNSVTLTSDKRLKTNIKNLNAISRSKLSQLNAVTYNFKPDSILSKNQFVDSASLNRNHMGFLAQDVQNIYPELVYADKNGMLSLDYISLIPVLVESFKELNNNHVTDSLNFEKRIAQLHHKILEDSLYFENKFKTLANQLSQCCGTSKLKSSSIDNTSNESSNPTDVAILSQNAPNPFNITTTIGYYLPLNVGKANIYIYNMQGLQLKSIPITDRGNGNITINGNELNPGMYLYALVVDGKEIDTKRMILTN